MKRATAGFGGLGVPRPLPEPWHSRFAELLTSVPASAGKAMAMCRLARGQPSLRAAALAEVDRLDDPIDRIFGLHMLIDCYRESERKREDIAIRAVGLLRQVIAERRFQSLSDRWNAWPDIGPQRFASWWYKPHVTPEAHLCALAPALPEARRRGLLLKLLEDTRRIDDGPWQTRTIAALLPHLADELPEEVPGDNAARRPSTMSKTDIVARGRSSVSGTRIRRRRTGSSLPACIATATGTAHTHRCRRHPRRIGYTRAAPRRSGRGG